MPGKDFEIVAPEDIRTEPMTFRDMLIRCLDRIHVVGCQMAEKNTKAALAAYEESVVIVHCYVESYYNKQNKSTAVTLIKDLSEERQFKDIERLQKLRELLSLILRSSHKVIQPPAIDVEYDMLTSTQKKAEEEAKVRQVIRRLISEDRQKELMQWIERGGQEEKIKVQKPKIEDIIDKTYLQRDSNA